MDPWGLGCRRDLPRDNSGKAYRSRVERVADIVVGTVGYSRAVAVELPSEIVDACAVRRRLNRGQATHWHSS